MSTLTDLYDSEINFIIETLWHGIRVHLGDEANGFLAETHVNEWHEVEPWLEAQAIAHYPDSAFAIARALGIPLEDAKRSLDLRLHDTPERAAIMESLAAAENENAPAPLPGD